MAKIGRPLAMPVDQRRKEIFLIAEKLFGERGFDNVTMAEIATLAGMSKKTIYVYFKDKMELFKELVSSSYNLSEYAFDEKDLDDIQLLKFRLKVCAQHVLSERHIKLCRLIIPKRVDMVELTTTFYEMGVSTSRNHLIEAIEKIDKRNFVLNLDADVLADMLFGASIAKPFVDTLMVDKKINFTEIFDTITKTVDALFTESETRNCGR